MEGSDPARAAGGSARLVTIGAQCLVAALRQARSQLPPALPDHVPVRTGVAASPCVCGSFCSWLL